jgi:List-Bact-rpt repeat protein
MRNLSARGFALACLLAASYTLAPLAQAQTYTSEAIMLGTGGYIMNFEVEWTCDDSPAGTVSAPGEVDLVDANGDIVAEVVATANATTPVVTVTGAGSVSGVTSSILIDGADGTPADGLLHGTWNISGPPPGAYTLHLWVQTRSVARNAASSITTDTRNAGGGGTVTAPTPTPSPTPTPTPTPTPSPTPTRSPPSIAISAAESATVFQALGISAAATMSSGGNLLASVAISASADNGSTWATLSTNPHPSSPSDTENISYAFASAGSALIRATVTDTAGLSGSSEQPVSVGRASQPAVAISPTSAAVTAGQSVAFTASGGATGNYAWGGLASGAGAAQTVAFPSPGTFAVTVADSGNSNYNPSPAASATVTVQPAYFTLSATASAGGTVAGGGSYPPNAQATAVATAGSGNVFTGWTGDVAADSPTVSVLMNSNKSIMAHFTALLAQTISFVPPGTVTTRTPAFTLSVTASSGLPVTLALDSGPVALAGNVVTPSGTTGEVTLTATQAGNTQYLSAQPVVITFSVGIPPAGVLLTDDSAATKRSDKSTRTTSYTSVPEH